MRYEQAGDFDRALDWMEKGYERRDPNTPYLGAVPISEELRRDPRYQDLLQRLNVPDLRANRG